MDNFKLMGTFDPSNVVKELKITHLWNWLNLRRNDPTLKHMAVQDIILRFQPVGYDATYEFFYNSLPCVDYFSQRYLPKTFNAVLDEFSYQNLGRVMVANLRPGEVIDYHIDEGRYAQRIDRYHMVVTSNENVTFTAGSDSVHMNAGEIWWFNNQALHMVKNNGQEDRIHIIVDIYK